MATISFILGIIGNVISILMFASPIRTFKQVVMKKSTENFKGLPYIMTLLSTSLWIFYGLLKPNGLLVVTVNGVGAGMQIIYVFLFLIYAPKNVKAASLKLVGLLDIGFLGAVVLATMLGFHGLIRLKIAGLLCAGLTIGMYAAPLSAMRNVIKSKSVKYMPFFLSFFQFLNGAIWTAYAVFVRDYFIGVPNAIGFLLGFAQLTLYMIYNRQSISNENTHEAADSTHLSNNNAIQLQILDKNDETNAKNGSIGGESNPTKSSFVFVQEHK